MSREAMGQVEDSKVVQFCLFRVAQDLVGIDVQHVQEVLYAQALRRVPLAPSEVKGLINLRGQIVTAIDLRQMLGIVGDQRTDEHAMNVVVRYNDEAVSLRVDEAGDVIEISDAQFEPVPATVASQIRRLSSGALHLEEGLVLVLNIDASVRGNSEVDVA